LRGEAEDTLKASLRGSAAELEAQERRRGERSEETTVTQKNDFGCDEPLADGVMERKFQARKAGVRGETYAYSYLRRLGCVFVARDYMPRGVRARST
jgi:hypothetical protein